MTEFKKRTPRKVNWGDVMIQHAAFMEAERQRIASIIEPLSYDALWRMLAEEAAEQEAQERRWQVMQEAEEADAEAC